MGVSDIEGKAPKAFGASKREASEFQIRVWKRISLVLLDFFLRHLVRFDDLPVAGLIELEGEKKVPAEIEIFCVGFAPLESFR